MYIPAIVLVGILVFFAIYALYKEYIEHDDAFTYNKASDKDSISSSLGKLEKCLRYDQKTIKWRRILLTTLLSVSLIFGILYQRFPSTKELLIFVCFIFVSFYTNWQHYSSRTASGAIKYGTDNISNVKKQLSKNHNFILPWNY